jgi:ADP-ribosylglycohydrolase
MQPLEIGEASTVAIGGGRERAAIAFVTGAGMRRTAWCGVLVGNSDATVLVTLGRGAGAGIPSCAEILGEPNLAAFARTFELRERRVPPPSGVTIRGWAAALKERASMSRAAGALLGLAVGDALGTTNEFKALDAPAFPQLATGPIDDVVGGGPFKLVAGQVTDDTQMAAAIADLMIASDIVSAGALAQRYAAWRGVAFDAGVQITQALDQIADGVKPENAGRSVWEARERFPAGNGSLMRTAVIGVLLAGLDDETRRRATFIDSAVTHFDPRCQLACAAFNAAIAHALTGDAASAASMIRAAADELDAAAVTLRRNDGDIGNDIEAARAMLASDLDAARESDPQLYTHALHVHASAGYVRVAFRLAFWSLVHAPDYRSAVVNAANRGGDADTNAAIVGALVGALHGVDAIPRAWRDRVMAAPGLAAGTLDLHPRTLVRALELAFGSDAAVRGARDDGAR